MTTTPLHSGATSALAKILSEASGFDLNELDHQATFLELGFDSLFLIQLSQKIKTQLKVKITFRQLIEELPSIDALVDYLANNAPADRLAQDVSAVAELASTGNPVQETAPSALTSQLASQSAGIPEGLETPSIPIPAAPLAQLQAPFPSTPASATASGLEQVITQQNQLMALQLQLLTGTPISAAQTAAAAPQQLAPSDSAQTPAQPSLISNLNTVSSRQEAPNTHVAGDQPSAQKKLERFGPYKPVRRASGGGLTAEQQESLDRFTARFTSKTKGSKDHAQRHRKHFADPRGVAGYRRIWKSIVYQIAVERSLGSKLWDIDGNEYIDIAMGFGLNLFGQSPEFITEALHKQLDHGVEVGPQSPLAGEVAQLLCDFSRKDRATFCNTGSEAVMAAMRLARTVTGKNKIVFFNKDYHGNFDEVLLRCNRIGNKLQTAPAAPGIPQEIADTAIVLNYGTDEALNTIRENADDIAAVLVEPVQSADPFNQPREFLHSVRKVTQDNDIAMIMDEVITGFRAGQGGAQEWFDVWADMATYGKILGGGLPIGALTGSAKYMDALDGGHWLYEDDSEPEADMTFFAGTFVRHPLAMVSAHQVLMKVKEGGPELQQKLNEKTTYLADSLNEFFENNFFPIRVAQFTSLFRFMFPADLEYADLLYFHLLDRGIFTRGWADNCFLSTAHSDSDVEKIIDAVKDSCLEIRAGGFMPRPDSAPSEILDADASSKEEEHSRFPLTETQQEIFLTSKFTPESACAFNEPFTLRLKGKLDVERFCESVQTVLKRHKALHVEIDAAGEYQKYLPPRDFPIVQRDLRQLSDAERNREIAATEKRFGSSPFDITSEPLVRIELLRLEDDHFLVLFDGHHIVTDGWSWNVMLVEMGKVYSAAASNHLPVLDPPASFREYVQGDAEREQDAQEATEYWLKKFSSLPSTLDLPLDHSRGSRQTYNAKSVIHDFAPETYQALKDVASNNGVSLFSVGFAAFKLMLAKLSGQDDIVVGMRTAGQSLLENQNLVGLCMNILPMRSQFDPASKLSDTLKDMQSDVLEAFEYQDCSLGRIVRNLNLPRQSNRMPLTDIHFNLDRDSTEIHFANLENEVGMTAKEAINFDLFFNLNETSDGLKLYFDYNCDIYEEETICRWIEHYEAILHSIATNPEQTVANLSILSEQQRHQIQTQWNATQSTYPHSQTTTQLFEKQALDSPLAPAITFEGTRLTYSELNERANALAHHLRSLGVTESSYVGILLERSEKMVIAALAIMKAGATYVPMDPEFPAERLQMMADDSGLQFMVTQAKLISRGIAASATRILIDSDAPTIESHSREDLNIEIAPQQSAYVIYTSGSTGKPKGVQIPHLALTNFLCSMQAEPGIGPADTLAGVTTLSFDIAALELYLPLIAGAHLLVVGQRDSTDGKRLADIIAKHKVTVLQATPERWRLMIEAGWNGSRNLKILCGGEAMPASLANALVPRGAEVWNLYGPTETTIWSTSKKISDPEEQITIGRPIANTQIYILDRQMNSVPIGVLGDLYIGGDGLALGYLDRAELTAEKFVDVSISGAESRRLYNTGDQAKYLANGEIDFVGRSDYQVKISGYRIELGEIEVVLGQHEKVEHCVVTVYEDETQHRQLVAYIKTTDGDSHYTEIRDYAKQALPNYMMPSSIQFVKSFPQTPNGKIDRKKLPLPSLDRPQFENSFVEASSKLEKQIASIFSEVVSVDRIGIHDNFFELGGHSLSATKVIARISEQLPVSLTIADIFDAPTIAELANKVKELSSQTAATQSIRKTTRQKRRI